MTPLTIRLAGLLAVAAASNTQAAVITWGAATNISGDSDISTAGTFIGAVALGASPVSPTINGVTFTGVNPADPFSSGPFNSNGFISGTTFFFTTGAPHTDLSAPYEDLLRSLGFTVGGTLTLSGLTLGNTYQLQLWADVNGTVQPIISTAAAGNIVTLDTNTTDSFGGIGQFAFGTFIADAATQDITLTGIFNAFQLRELPPVSAVPEPGSALVGMLALGLCGLGSARCRRG